VEGEIVLAFQIGPEAHPAFYARDTGSFQGGRGVNQP